MALDTITREEFDRRLEQSTERMRQERLALEVRAAELKDSVERCAFEIDKVTEAELTRSISRLSGSAFTQV